MTEVMSVGNGYRLAQWAQVAAECQASGVSNRQFCQNRGISEKTYYYWLRKLRVQAAGQMVPELIRFEEPEQPKAGNPSPGAIKLHYREGELEIPAGTDSGTIAAVLMALRNIC